VTTTEPRSGTPASDVSVIVPALNVAPFVDDAVRSLLGQSLVPREIIVVDNGSTDATRDRLASYGDRITVVEIATRGASTARNAGLRTARSEFVAFQDADDVSLPERLERQSRVLEADPDAALVYCAIDYVEEDGRPTGRRFDCSDYRRRGFQGLLFLRNRIPTTSAVLARRSILLDAGGFDERLSHNEEYDLWLRLAGRHPVACLDEPLVQYRLHRGNISHDAAQQRENTRRALVKHGDAEIRRALTDAFTDGRDAEWAFGCVLFGMARLEEALGVFSALAGGARAGGDVEFMRGNTLMALGRLAEARAAYEDALSVNPANAPAANNLGVLFHGVGRIADARRAFDRAANLNRQYDDPRANLAALAADGRGASLRTTLAPLRRVLKPAPRAGAELGPGRHETR
jgi:glycosyltransferase involved in cell wall biosynthesis